SEKRRSLPLWIWPVQGGSPIRGGNIVAEDATWCPDGQHLLYARDREIHRVQRDGTDDRVLSRSSGIPESIRWAPDASRFPVTVAEPQSDGESIWEANADGSGAHPRFPEWRGTPLDCCGEWTPDGKYFVFTSSRSGFSNLWAVRENRSLLHWKRPVPV